jgi:hypothetical protein
MIGTMNRSRGTVLAALLSGAALVLLALVPSVSHAVSATQTQELQAEIASQVSWGSAGGCTQNIKTNNFGNLIPSPTAATLGSFDAMPEAEASTAGTAKVWVGCVTANTTLASVAAAGTTDMKSGSNTLPLSNVAIGLTNSSAGSLNGGTAGCAVTAGQSSAGSCTLESGGASRTLVSGANAGTTELDWQYQLNLPANQAIGTYTGGLVTFTATA